MVYMTDRIHHDTLTGKGYNYWNTSGRKSGQMIFFWCDISATETAKKIVTKYCNQNDCFAYLMVNANDHTDVQNNFSTLVEDVGEKKILNVSDYRDLIKSTPKARGSKGSKGSVSDQDIFLIFGDQKNTSPLNYDYNDATLMRSLSKDRLDDLEDEDEIVYIPILRYATATTDYPSINSLYSHKDFFEKYKVFDNTNIYAIKHSVVDRLIKEGYNLVDFNTWFKTRLKKLNDNKFKDIYQFNSLVEQCRNEYNSDDKMNRGYGQGYIDRQFLFHVLNMFGLEYDQFINNKKIVSTLDSLMILEFFTDTIHREEFDIAKFKKDDYYGHMTKLLNDFGINGLDSAKIKDSNVVYNQINRIIDSMYDSDKVSQYKRIFKKAESDNEYVAPKIADLRKTIKAELDNNPILKYTMCVTPVSGNLRELRNVNPLKQNDGSRGNYYRDNNGWFSTINDLDKLKVQFGQIVG
jgi:hypothetical protein